MSWIIWAATLSLLVCGALVARIAESPLLAYWLAQCAGVVVAGLATYGIVKIGCALPVRDESEVGER